MNIVAFAGKKGSGKSTMCNFLHGYFMKSFGVIDGFEIMPSGDLVIETDVLDENNQISKSKGVIDVRRLDIDFAMWASSSMWPIVKHYAFATPVKEVAIELFGLKREHVYGSDDDKNQLTGYKWKDLVSDSKKTGFVTVREFLQTLATEIFRKIYDDVWAERTIKDILAEGPILATISDLRFPNEYSKVKENNGKTIFLTGGVDGDKHSSENSFDKMEFDAVIDTKTQTVDESCHQLVALLTEWEIIPKEIVVETPKPEKPNRGIGKIK